MLARGSISYNVIILYVLATYIPQYFIYALFNEGFVARYNVSLVGVFLLPLNIIFLLVFARVRLTSHKVSISRVRLPWAPIAITSFVFLCVSLYFFITYDAGFRHTNRVSEAGAAVYLLYFLKPLCLYLVLRYIMLLSSGRKLLLRERTVCLVVLVSLVLSATGSLAILGVAVAFVGAFFSPKIVQKKANIQLLAKLSIPLVVTFISVLFMGIANKVGFHNAIAFIANDGPGFLENSAIRVCTSFVSAAAMSVSSFEDPLNFEALGSTFSTFLYRIDFLLPDFLQTGGGEYLKTVNRINYLNVMQAPDLYRAGASPGLIGSFLYMPLYPISIIIMGLYVKYLIFSIESCSQESRGGLIPVLCTLVVILPLFESPLSVFNVLDPVFITFFVFSAGIFLRLR